MRSKPNYSAPALDKGLDILEILAKTVMPMTMSEISEKAGRSRGEIFRMLQVLESRRYITRNDSGDGYLLTNKLFMLGMERPPVKGVVETALPAMHRLADEIWQPCHLVVASEEHIVVIARVDAPGDLGFVVRVGHRRPLVDSTSGLVLLAFQPDDVRERWLDLAETSGITFERDEPGEARGADTRKGLRASAKPSGRRRNRSLCSDNPGRYRRCDYYRALPEARANQDRNGGIP